MDTMTALLTRRTPGKLSDPAPSADQVERILEAAAHAPDHARLRPWRFIVIQGSALEKFGEARARGLMARRPASSASVIEAERNKPRRAPLNIVVTVEYTDNPAIPHIEQLLAVGAAVQNLLLAAHALGFGAFWSTGAAAYDPIVKQALGLRESDTIVGVIYLGTVETPGKPRTIEYADRCTYWNAGSESYMTSR